MSFEVNPALFNNPWGNPPPNTPVLPAVGTQSPKVTPESVATSAEATSAKADATISKWSAKAGFDDAQSSSHAERVALAAAISAQLSAADKQQFANEMLAASSGALNFGLRGVMAAPTPATAGPVAAQQPTAPAAPTAPTAPVSTVSAAPLTSADPQQAAKLADIMNFSDRIKALLGKTGDAIADQVLKVASAIKVPEGGAIPDGDFKTLLKAVDTARQQTLEAVRVGGAEVVKVLSNVSAALSGVPNTGELKAAVEQAKTGWQDFLAAIAARKPFSLEQVEKLNASTGKVINDANKFIASSKPSSQPAAVAPAPVATATPTMYAVGTNTVPTAGGKPNPTEALTQSKGFAEADKLAAKEAADEKENAEKAEAASGDR
jgi:hypothetical protein